MDTAADEGRSERDGDGLDGADADLGGQLLYIHSQDMNFEQLTISYQTVGHIFYACVNYLFNIHGCR